MDQDVCEIVEHYLTIFYVFVVLLALRERFGLQVSSCFFLVPLRDVGFVLQKELGLLFILLSLVEAKEKVGLVDCDNDELN